VEGKGWGWEKGEEESCGKGAYRHFFFPTSSPDFNSRFKSSMVMMPLAFLLRGSFAIVVVTTCTRRYYDMVGSFVCSFAHDARLVLAQMFSINGEGQGQSSGSNCCTENLPLVTA